jgi:hypothetical protein
LQEGLAKEKFYYNLLKEKFTADGETIAAAAEGDGKDVWKELIYKHPVNPGLELNAQKVRAISQL